MDFVELHRIGIASARYWARTTSFKAFMTPAPTQAKALHFADDAALAADASQLDAADGSAAPAPWVYRTDANDTKVLDAVLDLWAVDGLFQCTVGKRRLASLAGMSPNGARRALDRLASAGIVEVRPGAEPDDGMTICLGMTLVHEVLDPAKSLLDQDGPPPSPELLRGVHYAQALTTNEYTPRKARDAWQSGTSRTMRKLARRMTHDGNLTPGEWLDWHTMRGLGESGLRVADALQRLGDATALELADATGKSLSAIRTALKRLDAAGCVAWEQESSRAPKVWRLAPTPTPTPTAYTAPRSIFDYAEGLAVASVNGVHIATVATDAPAPTVYADAGRIAAPAPAMRTANMAIDREDRRLEQAQLWARRRHESAVRAGDADAATVAWRRYDRLLGQRIDVLMRLYPHWDKAMARRYAADLPMKQWTRRRAELALAGQDARQRQADVEMVRSQRRDLADQLAGADPADARRILNYAEFNAGDIYTILKDR